MWSDALDSCHLLLSHSITSLASPMTNILMSTLKHTHIHIHMQRLVKLNRTHGATFGTERSSLTQFCLHYYEDTDNDSPRPCIRKGRLNLMLDIGSQQPAILEQFLQTRPHLGWQYYLQPHKNAYVLRRDVARTHESWHGYLVLLRGGNIMCVTFCSHVRTLSHHHRNTTIQYNTIQQTRSSSNRYDQAALAAVRHAQYEQANGNLETCTTVASIAKLSSVLHDRTVEVEQEVESPLAIQCAKEVDVMLDLLAIQTQLFEVTQEELSSPKSSSGGVPCVRIPGKSESKSEIEGLVYFSGIL